MSRTSVIDLDKAIGNNALLPPSYTKALDNLTAAPKNPRLSTLSDTEHLSLVKEVLSNLYNRKHDWTVAGSWTHAETDLLQLHGTVALAQQSNAQFGLASMVADYLCTLIQALECKLDKRSGKQPELLSKKRQVSSENGGDAHEVYGPAGLGALLPGNTTMEVWVSSSKSDHVNDTYNTIEGRKACRQRHVE